MKRPGRPLQSTKISRFAAQPSVINGCSDLMGEVFGPVGVHARSAVGTNALPLNVPVEIEAIVEVGSGCCGSGGAAPHPPPPRPKQSSYPPRCSSAGNGGGARARRRCAAASSRVAASSEGRSISHGRRMREENVSRVRASRCRHGA